MHHSTRPVALASMNICVQNETFHETSNYIVFSGCATSLFLNSLDKADRQQFYDYTGRCLAPLIDEVDNITALASNCNIKTLNSH